MDDDDDEEYNTDVPVSDPKEKRNKKKRPSLTPKQKLCFSFSLTCCIRSQMFMLDASQPQPIMSTFDYCKCSPQDRAYIAFLISNHYIYFVLFPSDSSRQHTITTTMSFKVEVSPDQSMINWIS